MILILTFETEAEQRKFEHIYEKYKNLMMHKAFGILRDPQLAEDAASEAFLRVYKNLHKIEDPDSPRTAAFVVTIVKNTALDIVQRRGQANTVSLEDEILPDRNDVEEQILAVVSSEQIYKVVDALDESLRSVFLLKFAYSMNHREIGKALNITENNVTVRLHRAKKKLAAALREEGMARG